MNVVFRVDASSLIGTGHVMRCRTLAAALRQRGAKILFITRKHFGHLAEVLVMDGFQVELLPEPIDQAREPDYSSWLGVSQLEDARQTIALLQSVDCDLLIVDHYSLNSVWESLLRPYASKIMVIDDLANRQHHCDLLLNQNYSLLGPERYQSLVVESCKLLLGPSFALLRPEYARVRKYMPPRRKSKRRILIYMGGSDISNVTKIALEALSIGELNELEVDVVIGSNFIHQDEVIRIAKSRPNTRIFGPQPHLAELMASADLAIGAGGATTLERLCMGLPSLVICAADNQIQTIKALAECELVRYLGVAKNITAEVIQYAVKQEIAAVQSVGDQNYSTPVVDGMGAQRVSEILYPTPISNLVLRHANMQDLMTYFVWVNDSKVRSSAIQSSVIDFITHVSWFERMLVKPNTWMYVLEASGLPVGQVRFESQDKQIIIDYSLDQNVRGRRWGEYLIRLGIKSLIKSATGPIHLCAVVKNSNLASVKVFESLGFVRSISGVGKDESRFLLTVPTPVRYSLNENLIGKVGSS